MQTPRTVPIARPGRGRWIASGVGLALATLAVLTVPRYLDRRANARYRAAVRSRADDLVRWKGWLETSSCLRRDDGARWLPGSDAAGDPVDPACMKALAPLATDPALPAGARAAVASWLEADRAFTGAAADRLRGLLDARDRVLATARSQLLPAVRAQIRWVADRHAARRDYVWWHFTANIMGSYIFAVALYCLWRERDEIRASFQRNPGNSPTPAPAPEPVGAPA
jgi:hypothetical protein